MLSRIHKASLPLYLQVSFLSSCFTRCSSLFNLEERITNEHQRYIEHDNCVCLSSLTEHATEHKAAAAEHLDEFTTATEQMQIMSISATTLAATLSNASKNAQLVRTAQEIAKTLRKEILVEVNNDMWWVKPHELSSAMLSEWQSGATQVSFVWDWMETRTESFQLDGENTALSRYIIDFQAMLQGNTDNNRTHRVKVVGSILNAFATPMEDLQGQLAGCCITESRVHSMSIRKSDHATEQSDATEQSGRAIMLQLGPQALDFSAMGAAGMPFAGAPVAGLSSGS